MVPVLDRDDGERVRLAMALIGVRTMSNQTLTAPQGFLAAGVKCGIKQADVPDLALLVCERPAAAAALDFQTPSSKNPIPKRSPEGRDSDGR